MLDDEVVRRRRWLTREQFLDMLGATNLIPGPNSTEMAIHVGLHRAGLPGLAVAGLSFILPAALITLLVAWAYVRFGTLPQVGAFLYGAKPAIIVVVAQALWRLGRTALRSRFLALAALVALAASALGVDELVVLFGTGGVLGAAEVMRGRLHGKRIPPAVVPCLVPLGIAGSAVTTAATYTLGGLFLFFVKVGAVLFGSGYVLLAFLRADLVERWHWLTNEQLLDAITVGQITPGPVFTTATFIGYLLGRTQGAIVATVGIFLPAFVFVALSGPLIPRLRQSGRAAAFLDGLNVASLALLALVTWALARSAVVDWKTGCIALGAALLLGRFGLGSAWIVLGGGLVGLVAC
jgi:chromate transporter